MRMHHASIHIFQSILAALAAVGGSSGCCSSAVKCFVFRLLVFGNWAGCAHRSFAVQHANIALVDRIDVAIFTDLDNALSYSTMNSKSVDEENNFSTSRPVPLMPMASKLTAGPLANHHDLNSTATVEKNEEKHPWEATADDADDATTDHLHHGSEEIESESTPAVPTSCGFCKTGLQPGDSGIIQSPNFPQPYHEQDNSCLWLLQTANTTIRIELTCNTIELPSCGYRSSGQEHPPNWNDYLIVSPLWTFKKSWVYCGHATRISAIRHISICDKMAITFRTVVGGRRDNNRFNRGFHCTYKILE